MRYAPDVIVVGAGPAGAAVAALLAAAGLQVALLDKARRTPTKTCGESLSPGCRPILERLEVLPALHAAGARPLRGIRVETARAVLAAEYPREADGRTGALALPRARLDPILLEAAARRGAHLVPDFQVTDLLREDGAVVGVQGRRAGREATLRARLVLGADGRQSVVARRLGGVRRHPWLDKLALVGYFAGVARADDAAEIFVGRGRYAILNPVTEELTNIGAVVDREDFRPGRPVGPQFREVLDGLPGLPARLPRAAPASGVRCLGALAFRALRVAAPGAALLGDAAGFLDPFTGEGIHAALRSAELLAREALPALARDAHPHLSGYAAAWRREIRRKWRLCTLIQHAVRRPWLADRLVARLAARPARLQALLGLVGDLRPPPGAAALLALGLRLALPANTETLEG